MTTATANSAPNGYVSPNIHSGDRLCFTVFVALAVHASIILGIGFDFYINRNQAPVIEVTLAHNPDTKPPEKADYMAQENQLGGGELKEKALPSILEPTEYIEQEINEVSEQAPPTAVSAEVKQQITQISTINESTQKVVDLEQQEVKTEALEDLTQEISLLERSLELASLDAKLDIREQLQTKNTRIRRVSSVSSLKTADAYYVKQWIKKIHRVGRLNYPEEARRRNIYGDLRVSVALLPNGHIKDIRVLRSSGHKVLDDAAIRIVRLAEPFAPFPDELKREYDELEITRTWLFSKDGHTPVL